MGPLHILVKRVCLPLILSERRKFELQLGITLAHGHGTIVLFSVVVLGIESAQRLRDAVLELAGMERLRGARVLAFPLVPHSHTRSCINVLLLSFQYHAVLFRIRILSFFFYDHLAILRLRLLLWSVQGSRLGRSVLHILRISLALCLRCLFRIRCRRSGIRANPGLVPYEYMSPFHRHTAATAAAAAFPMLDMFDFQLDK
jgi:hypothetical protein